MSLSPCYNAELHGREMDSGRSRRRFTPPVFHQSKSGSAPQDLTSEVSTSDPLLPTVEYHNYWLFSTTTLAEAHLTYGYFGRVHITDKISRCSGLEEALK